VNGLTGYNQPVFNGMGALAARLTAMLVIDHGSDGGNIYLRPAGRRDVGEEYTYTIYCEDEKFIRLQIRGTYHKTKTLYDGPIEQFNPEDFE